METRGDASRTSGLVPWPDSARRAHGRMAGAGEHASVPPQRSRSKGSLQCPALPPPALRGQYPGALAASGSLYAGGNKPVRPAEPPAAHTRQGRCSAGARARAVPAPRHRQPLPALRGGVEGAPPQPAETAVEGGTRPRRSALEERSRYKSSAPAPAPQWLCPPRGAPLPCSPAPAPICTHIWATKDGGQPGSRSSAPGSESAPGASSQPRLRGPPLANNSDLGKRSACRLPETKGKREFVRGSAARALSLALLFWKRALC